MISKIYKTENIIKVTPDETLSAIMAYFSSSHDAAFVFDKQNFLGVVNPYYCLIKKSYPANTKAKHCLTHPPHININMKLEKVARVMMDSKIHYLPVFEIAKGGQKFTGIISARRLLTAIQDSTPLKIPLSSFVQKRKPLISIFEDDFISKAMPLFKQHRISKLIVISQDLKLRGVLSYFDLISFLTAPRERQGFSREGNKVPLLHARVKNFMKSNVLTLTVKNQLSDAVRLILDKQIGSVIIIDAETYPVGIITTKDLLSTYISRKQLFEIDLVTRDLSEKSHQLVRQFIIQSNKLFSRRGLFDRAQLIIKGKETAGGVFEAIFSLLKRGEKPKVIHIEGKNLPKVLESVKKKGKRVLAK